MCDGVCLSNNRFKSLVFILLCIIGMFSLAHADPIFTSAQQKSIQQLSRTVLVSRANDRQQREMTLKNERAALKEVADSLLSLEKLVQDEVINPKMLDVTSNLVTEVAEPVFHSNQQIFTVNPQTGEVVPSHAEQSVEKTPGLRTADSLSITPKSMIKHANLANLHERGKHAIDLLRIKRKEFEQQAAEIINDNEMSKHARKRKASLVTVTKDAETEINQLDQQGYTDLNAIRRLRQRFTLESLSTLDYRDISPTFHTRTQHHEIPKKKR